MLIGIIGGEVLLAVAILDAQRSVENMAIKIFIGEGLLNVIISAFIHVLSAGLVGGRTPVSVLLALAIHSINQEHFKHSTTHPDKL